MSIVKLKKVTLCGLVGQKATIIDDLQGLGVLHLVPLSSGEEETEPAKQSEAGEAHYALKYLLECPRKRRPLRHDETFRLDELVKATLVNRDRSSELSDHRDFLTQRIKDVEPWGDFVLPDEDALGGYKLWFYRVPQYTLRLIDPDLVWQIVHRDPRFAHVVVVARDEPGSSAMPVPRTHTGTVPLSRLREKLEETEIELEDLMAERETLTRWIFLLANNLARADDQDARSRAAQQTRDDEHLFALQGWISAEELGRLQAFTAERGLAYQIEDVAPDDSPPTLLDNPEGLKGGESLVKFFQTPAYAAWDPSLVLFFSFSVFFAMILADAGYAAVLGILLLVSWRRLGQSPIGAQLRMLAASLVASAVVYGVMIGSYFGLPPAEGSLLERLKVIDLNDFDSQMRLSIIIGVVHIGLANAVVAWHNRGSTRALASLGWISAVFGGLIMWLGGFLAPIGPWLLVGGLVAVFFFSSVRPVSRPLDGILRVLDGLGALTNVTRAFGDVLSYLRLFALGLASASLAITFNDLARNVATEMPAMGFFLSLIILVFGHTLNLALAIVSGVVHGLRLNYIEFYNWGEAGEGQVFKAFSKKEIEA